MSQSSRQVQRQQRLQRSLDRLLHVALPLSGLAIAGRLFIELAGLPFFGLNASRLSWSFALAHGYQLYLLPDEGPLVDYHYTPLAAISYLPATLASTPSPALLIGGILTLGFVLLPAVWLHAAGERGLSRTVAAASFLAFCIFLVHDAALERSAFMIHADAPALGLCVAACACLMRGRPGATRPRATLALAALFAVLAVWTKQTAIAIVWALPLHLLLAEGAPTALRYLLYMALASAGTAAAFGLAFGPERIVYNLLLIPLNQIAATSDALPSAASALARLVWILRWPLVVIALLLVWSRRRVRGWRVWLRDNPWTLLLTVALCMAPVATLAARKVGGNVNSYSFATTFAIAAATVGLAGASVRTGAAGLVARAGLLLILAVGVVAGLGSSERWSDFERAVARASAFRNNPEEKAYRFALRHPPGQVYFPLDPLPTLLAEGALYNMSLGMISRSVASVSVSPALYWRYLPPDLRVVAMRQWFPKVRFPFPKRLAAAGFVRQRPDPALPGWELYRRRANHKKAKGAGPRKRRRGRSTR